MGSHPARFPLEFQGADIGRRGTDRVVVDLDVGPGSVVSLQAPEQMAHMATLVASGGVLPFEGRVRVLGRDTRTFDSAELERLVSGPIGVLRGLPAIHDSLSLLDNALVLADARGLPRRETLPRAESLLGEARLGTKLHTRASSLTSTELRWAALVRVLITGLQVVVAEPGALDFDRASGEAMLRLLRQFALESGAGVFWATPSTRMAVLADKMYTFSLGRIVDIDEV